MNWKTALSDAIVLDGYGRAFHGHRAESAQASSSSLGTDFVQDFAGLVSSVTDVATDGDTTLSFTSSGDLTHGGFRVFSLDRSNQRFDLGIVASSAFFTTPGAGGNRHGQPSAARWRKTSTPARATSRATSTRPCSRASI
jgi:hypothetical protein